MHEMSNHVVWEYKKIVNILSSVQFSQKVLKVK